MHSSGRFRASSRSHPRWDSPDPDSDAEDAFLSASDLVKTLQPVPRHKIQSRRPLSREPRRWPPMETHTPPEFTDWPFDGTEESSYRPRTPKAGPPRSYPGGQLEGNPNDARGFQMGYEMEPRHPQAQLQRYQQQKYQRAMQREFGDAYSRRHPEQELYVRETRGREAIDDLPFDPPRRIPRSAPHSAMATSSPIVSLGFRPNGLTRETHARAPNRRYNPHSPVFGPRVDEFPLEPAMLDMYPEEVDAAIPRRRDYAPQRQRSHHIRRPQIEHLDDELLNSRRSFQEADLPCDRRAVESRAVYEELVATPTTHSPNLTPRVEGVETVAASTSFVRPREVPTVERVQKLKRTRPDDPPTPAASVTEEPEPAPKTAKPKAKKRASAAKASVSEGKDADSQPKRRCGRKSMNYSSEQKRERNRAAVKKCRQRQALKLEYLQHKAESLAAENQALSEMLVKNTELEEQQRTSLTRGIQMDILLKIKEIFTQSLPKDFVLDADSIWDLNSVLAVSMPSRCYYGIESIKDFWRTSLRMRNKGKIRSFWAWLFRLPPGDRFTEFDIQPFSPTSNLYFISWTTKSTPPLAGSMVIMFGNGHRVTLHVECFGWLIWRYLLTNEPFPEPPLE